MSVGRRRIRGTCIICIHSLVLKLVVVVTNTIPQVDIVRRLSMHWKYYVSLYIISLSLSLSLSLSVIVCIVYVYLYLYAMFLLILHGVYVHYWKLYEILFTVKVLVHHLWCFYENKIYDKRIIVSVYA